MSTKLTLKISLFLLFLLQFGSAQEVYIGNRPFEGPTSDRGLDLKVGARELVEALGWTLENRDGVLVVGESEVPQGTRAGLVVEGTLLEVTAGEAGSMVNLKQVAEAAGLTYRSNPDLGTVDVLASKNKGGASGRAVAVPGEPLVLNGSTPGELINVDSYIVPGKLNFFLWYKTGQKDPGYRSAFSEVNVLAKYPNVQLVKVNVGDDSSPLAQKYPGMVPRLVVVKNGRCIMTYNGHSLLAAVKKPETLIDLMWKK